jgi:hypothetical protein
MIHRASAWAIEMDNTFTEYLPTQTFERTLALAKGSK